MDFVRGAEHLSAQVYQRGLSSRLLCAVMAMLLSIIAGPAWATSYSVPGDFATIQAALNAAIAGDTITVAAGTYAEKISFPQSGDAGQGYIRLQAAVGPRPVLDGTSVAGANMVLIDSRSYVKLIGFELRNNLGVNDGSGVRVLGAGTHIEIRDNQIHDMRGQHAMGITVYATEVNPISDLIIDGNEIYDCEPYQSEALTLNGNVTTFAVTNNIVRDVNNIGIDFIGGETDIQPDPTKVARNGVCRGNQVLRAKENSVGGFAAGIYIDGGQNIVVENNVVAGCDIGIEVGAENSGIIASGNIVRDNVFMGNEKGGIAFGGYAPSVGRANGNQFLNNTCYQNDTLGAGFGELWIQYGTDNVVRNNIFFSTAQNILIASYGGNVDTLLDYNLWYAAAGASSGRFVWNGTEYVGFAAYQSGTGQDASSLFVNPQLTSPGAGDVHLTGTSPAINAGDPAFVPASGEVDIDGQARVTGVRVDIGADETGFCGNGTVDPGEECDDSNLSNCDGCDGNCTASACGNGILCPGETCDDGNVANSDCCAATCTLDVSGSACDDANLCTGPDTCDGAGTCKGGELPTTSASCFQPGALRASLSVKDNGNDARDLFIWKWRKGDDVDVIDLGDPTAGTVYALCLYDHTGGVPHLAMSISVASGGLWQASGDGFKFTDSGGGQRGLRKIKLEPGLGGRAKVLLKAKGATLLPPELPLAQNPKVIVELRNSAGACWQSNLSAPADTNTMDQFRDRED